ncbi:glycosyltransferase [Cribrihabitans pelagius]|uniref:glycosyltransferase n=1 Tax=Cribrihabitans pelagius TaxID=1765746 RepID=UPI003B5A9A40
MTLSIPKTVAIIIPARNEANRIAACLKALAGQHPQRVRVILVVNNTTDTTAAIARKAGELSGLDLRVLVRDIGPGQGAGTARRIGCAHAVCTMPDLRYFMTTDADSIVAPDWVARNLAHLQTVGAVCGKVDLIAEEAGILNKMDRRLATDEGTYRWLVQDVYARHAPGCADIRGTHGEAAGASLSFTKSAYLAVGGFAPVTCGEDRRIVRAFRSAGFRVVHADDVTVQASCRLTGRAAGGMSDALSVRITGGNYLVDDCLPPAGWIVKQANHGALGPWPPLVPDSRRLRVGDLPANIEILKKFQNSGPFLAVPITSAGSLPRSRLGAVRPDKGSAAVPDGSTPPASPLCKAGAAGSPQIEMPEIPARKGA